MGLSIDLAEYVVGDKFDFGNIPKSPGCYIFRNKLCHIIYIGKSKALHNRVKQHFNNTEPTDYKHIDMMRELHSVEIIVTDTETNALILECMLIKKHKPRYNSQLKKTKIFPYIRINPSQTYPTLTIADSVTKDGCKYYGSFYNRDDAQGTLELIGGIWQTPVCLKESFNNAQRPCLRFHLKKCCAPCGREIDVEGYRQRVEEIVKCLNGNFHAAVSRLEADMAEASGKTDYERAARLRDSILGLNRLKSKQKRLYTDLENKDVYLFFRAFGEGCFSLFFIRNGITQNRADLPGVRKPGKEELTAFINDNIRGKIDIEDGAFLTACLLEIGARKLFVPVSRRMSAVKIFARLESALEEFIDMEDTKKPGEK